MQKNWAAWWSVIWLLSRDYADWYQRVGWTDGLADGILGLGPEYLGSIFGLDAILSFYDGN